MSIEDFVTELRSYVGTPFMHQGRVPGVGLDCLGPFVVACAKLGYPLDDNPNYSKQPRPDAHTAELRKQLVEKSKEHLEEGDLLWISVRRIPQHVAVVTEISGEQITILHANQFLGRRGKVVETVLSENWKLRIHSVYRHPIWQQ